MGLENHAVSLTRAEKSRESVIQKSVHSNEEETTSITGEARTFNISIERVVSHKWRDFLKRALLWYKGINDKKNAPKNGSQFGNREEIE